MGHPAYEAYTLNDRPRLDAALADAKGYAARSFDRRAQATIAELEQQLADAYEFLQLRAKPHQQRVLDTLLLRRKEFDEHRHLVVAATGTGKTVMAALDYARFCNPGERRPSLLFVAHREQILQQARTTFRNALGDPNFGELLSGSGAPLAEGRYVFAMIQSLHSRLAIVPPDAFDVIYVDEAHHGAASSWSAVIDHFAPREIVGLTATPERADGVNISQLFGGDYTTELRLWEAVNDQLLAPFEYVGVDDGTDLRRLSWRQGDYATGELSSLYTGDNERVKRIVQAVRRWVEVPTRMRALGFCVSVDHARFMAEQFRALGLNADYLSGEHDQKYRDDVLARLRAGQLQIVFSVEVLGEGIDVPHVDTLLLLRPTQSPVLFTQQLGRGLRPVEGKSHCLVLDFIGQHRAEYRFEDRFRALVDTSHGSVLQQAENEFPFLPSGCAINLERVARERVLDSLKATVARPGLTGLKKDLAAFRSRSLGEFLADTTRSLERFYATDSRTMSWTRLLRTAGSPQAADECDTAELRQEEDDLLRRVGYLQHAADSLRTNTWFDWLTSSRAPDPAAFTPAEERLATQLFHQLLLAPQTLMLGFDMVWRHPALRDEIAELLTLTHAQLDAVPGILPGLEEVPLLAHARYTRAEVFAAVGVGSIDKPKEHREGVYFVPGRAIQLMFVTLHKDEKKFSSTTQYKDHAVTAERFHWETPNNWRQTSPAMLRCIGRGPEASQHRLLFVRERDKGAIEGTFRCLGQVDLIGDLEGERPVGLTWKLRQPLPEIVFESTQLVAAG